MSADTARPFEAYTALHHAARGDLEAQRALAREALSCAAEDKDSRAATEGLVFARMAASQGDNSDLGLLLQLLSVKLRAIATICEAHLLLSLSHTSRAVWIASRKAKATLPRGSRL